MATLKSLIRRVERPQRKAMGAQLRKRPTPNTHHVQISTSGNHIYLAFDIEPALGRRLNRLRELGGREMIEGFRIVAELVRDAAEGLVEDAAASANGRSMRDPKTIEKIH